MRTPLTAIHPSVLADGAKVLDMCPCRKSAAAGKVLCCSVQAFTPHLQAVHVDVGYMVQEDRVVGHVLDAVEGAGPQVPVAARQACQNTLCIITHVVVAEPQAERGGTTVEPVSLTRVRATSSRDTSEMVAPGDPTITIPPSVRARMRRKVTR